MNRISTKKVSINYFKIFCLSYQPRQMAFYYPSLLNNNTTNSNCLIKDSSQPILSTKLAIELQSHCAVMYISTLQTNKYYMKQNHFLSLYLKNILNS